MLLTEAEYREKGCCSDRHYKCIASGCAGWRWYDMQDEDGKVTLITSRTIGGWHGKTGRPEERRGYCGLAGRPDS